METNDIVLLGLQLKKLMMRKVEPIMKEYDLRPVELDLLFFLRKEKHVDTAKEIIEKKHLSKAHISKSIDNLCTKGFIKLTEDSNDRRIIHISLTDKSENVVLEVAEIYDECKTVMQKGISSDEMLIVKNVIEKIIKNINEELGK